jgi:hypothetical protein
MADLRSTYEKLYCEKTRANSRAQLIRQIAYRLQELEYGFLSEKYVKKLDYLANEMAKGKQFGEVSYCRPVNGTRVCKEYRGKKYEVESVEGGFACCGLFYKSLSALASKITGHKTNGLKFFGVKKLPFDVLSIRENQLKKGWSSSSTAWIINGWLVKTMS